ncbi:MAG: GYD domain-containing protein [Dehalococcoidia bacterium]
MATYIVLGHFTEQGRRNIKAMPASVRANQKRGENAQVVVKAFYFLQGEYDTITIVDAQDEETAMAAVLAIGLQGNVQTTTVRAFTVEEMERITERLPPNTD